MLVSRTPHYRQLAQLWKQILIFYIIYIWQDPRWQRIQLSRIFFFLLSTKRNFKMHHFKKELKINTFWNIPEGIHPKQITPKSLIINPKINRNSNSQIQEALHLLPCFNQPKPTFLLSFAEPNNFPNLKFCKNPIILQKISPFSMHAQESLSKPIFSSWDRLRKTRKINLRPRNM